jgi:S-formylglutathione hydrolase FrmB
MLSGLDLEATMTRLILTHKIPPMIVVAPSDGPTPSTDTEWTNAPMVPTYRWGSFVSHDLVVWAQHHLPVCRTRAGRAIGGLSMGAFGAINLALHHLSEFGSATLWSSYFLGNTPSIEGPEGSPGWWNDSPLEYLPGHIRALERTPLRLSFYSSPTDPFGFFPQNVAFAKLLSEHGISYRFHAYPGGHSMELWRRQLASQLTWLGRGLHC